MYTLDANQTFWPILGTAIFMLLFTTAAVLGWRMNSEEAKKMSGLVFDEDTEKSKRG